ncbi:NADPH:quinone reductase [Pelobacter seleniigenes]|uniref:NADPH:quinone reductase n=1 Tax=Pelobacter seleniigenes TaxID=407188 RepID=UPI001FE01C88|nr:NADPH:quinone reductase [Pelobacter seleniigenes]
MMQAIQVKEFGAPEVMQIQEIAAPVPARGQVKVDVKAIGVNPVDTYIRAGIYPLKPELPYIPGNDAAGIISAVGADVKHRQVGERVYVFGSLVGSYAEQLVCSENQVFTLPDKSDFSVGAAIGVPYTTAFYGLLYRAHALPGETVLIHGASGAVGQAAVQIAHSYGLRVIGTAGTTAGIKLLQEQGVVAALNHHDDNYLDAVAELTCGMGVDVILEMLANVNLDKDLKVVAKYGRIVVIGNRGTIEINPRDTMGKNASILGMAAFNASPTEFRQIHAVIHAGLQDGRFKPTIRTELPLRSAPEAHKLVMEPGGNGKIILIP